MNMNPNHHLTSNQNPATASALQQVNSINKQQICNGNVGGLYPNSLPIVAPSCFMNFPNQPFPMQNPTGQFPNNIGGFNPQQNFNSFPVNQFYPSQQQQGQFFANNSMIPSVYNQNVSISNEQVLLQNTIQNIQQLLQLQNPNQAQFTPGNSPMFQNQIANVTSHQNSGFPVNQQFGMSNPNGPVQHANQGQQILVSPMVDANASKQLPNMGQQLPGNTFLPHTSGPVQTQQANLFATLTNYQNQIAQGVGPQTHIFHTNQLFAMANPNGSMQHVNQGQQRFVSPMMNVNASRPIANMGDQGSSIIPFASASVQTQNLCPTLTKSEDNHGNMHGNVNGICTESQHKNFTGHKRSDASHTGFKSQLHHAKHVKEKLGTNNRINKLNKEGNSNTAVNSCSQNPTKLEKKLPSLKYTEQEIKLWREARKKHFPTSANMEKKRKKEQILSDVTNQEAMLRRQQLKEILAKQAELGCEVAEVPSFYLSVGEKHINRPKKHERGKYKRGKFRNKRGTRLQDDRFAKKMRLEDQDSFKTGHRTYEPKPKVREPSLLQKLLTHDIKRDKSHLLQVFRFIAVNSFFTGEPDESLRFPSVIVRETNPGEAVDMLEGKIDSEELAEEEEGEIIDQNASSSCKEVACGL